MKKKLQGRVQTSERDLDIFPGVSGQRLGKGPRNRTFISALFVWEKFNLKSCAEDHY